jgi:DNA (cytosine-5)-methyltransferase 1
MSEPEVTWYEFFAGGGMARLGLGEYWKCLFANEWCAKKAAAYTERFGAGAPKECKELKVEDVAKLTAGDLPGQADLAWASFPCQDLSLAGAGAGLKGERSGAFKPFWALMRSLVDEGRGPRIIVIENVVGTITSHGGRDLASILGSLVDGGYRAGAMVIDAIRFLPQSRPRLFIVAVQRDMPIPAGLASRWPKPAWHPSSLMRAYAAMPGEVQKNWLWWDLPEPTEPIQRLSELIEEEPSGVKWHTELQTKKLIGLMSALNRSKVEQARASGERRIGTAYKRTRPDTAGVKVQRAEVRFDEISGCLRTPAGGSSRQVVLVVEGTSVRSRLLSPREAARLMGVPEDYPIPMNYNEAYHLFGDGLAVPAVAWLNEHLLLCLAAMTAKRKAA